MLDLIKKYKAERPLALLIAIAFIPRLIAAIFSKGYGMHDDHFLIIEAAQSWVDGGDYNAWLPSSGATSPTGHSWFYVGLHYFFFSLLDFLGINSPQANLYWVRFGHALYSLLALPPMYWLAEKVGNKKTAFQAVLVFSLLYFIPMLSVRNLVELVSTVPLLWALWFLFKEEKTQPLKNVFIAGALMGVAMAIRFHMSLFVGGIGLVLLFRKQIIPAIVFSISLIVALFITQIADLFIWGRPFAEIGEYIAYNLANKTTYFSMPWYQYFIVIGGLMLPPISIAWLVGYFSSWRKHAMLFVPSLVFFAFHCYFPNKQERFIMPMYPIVLMFGVAAWHKFLEGKNSEKWNKANKIMMTFFWVVNTLLLALVTPAYSKKSRVESMEYLGQQADYRQTFVEYTVEYEQIQMPLYYSGKLTGPVYIGKSKKYNDEFLLKLKDAPNQHKPNYILFFENTDLDARVAEFESQFNAKIELKTSIEPSYLDALLHAINPVNSNEVANIYKIEYLKK